MTRQSDLPERGSKNSSSIARMSPNGSEADARLESALGRKLTESGRDWPRQSGTSVLARMTNFKSSISCWLKAGP